MIRPACSGDRQEPQNDLPWRAFTYAIGELGPVQIEEFERLLEVDQEAREALVEAVRLIESVRLAEASPEVPRLQDRHRPARRRMIAGVLSGLAASLALLLLRPIAPPPAGSSSAWIQRENVARAWSQLRETDKTGSAEARSTDLEFLGLDPSTESLPSPRVAIEEDESTEASPPGWLLLAAAPLDAQTEVDRESRTP